jgi:hypothetical protein
MVSDPYWRDLSPESNLIGGVMKKFAVFSVILAILFVTGGCSSTRTWVYNANSYDKPQTVSEKTAVVLPFNDARENENSNFFAMYLIPVMPFGWQTYKTPEGVQMHMTSGMWVNYKPVEDFPKALSAELQNAGMFKDVGFDYRKGNNDIIIGGKILSTEYDGYLISYGLSAYGPLLWYIGFPATVVTNELSVELTATDAKTDKQLFAKTYTAEPYSVVGWLYYFRSDFNYPEMLKGIYKDFVKDLKGVPGF